MTSMILGRKLGMTQAFREDGTVVGVTAVEAGHCVITQIKTLDKDGYNAIQMGFEEVKSLNKPERGHLGKLGLYKHLREFRISNPSQFEVGQKVTVALFKPGDLVDMVGVSKGKGFAGVVKRYHFAGGPKTHGQSDRWRAPGSVGSTTTPGRVFKGLRMAGHMGAERVTVRNLEVVRTDVDRNILLVKGAVPGARMGLLIIRKARS